MALQVLVNAVDVTSSTDLATLEIRNVGFSQTASAKLRIIDTAGTLTILPEHILLVKDGSLELFEGKIRNRQRTEIGTGSNRKKVYDLTAQDVTSYLVDDVCDYALRILPETDKDRIEWLLSTFGTKGVTGGSTVQQVYGTVMPANQDFSGMTLYEAIEDVCRVSGAKFYVAYDLTLHYFTSESNPSSWNFSDNPNGSTTFGYKELQLPEDTVELVNAVFVMGKDGVSVWRPDPGSWPTASQTAYGRREFTIRDSSITTTTEANAAGDAFIATHDQPKGPITLRTYKAGLKAGQTIQLTNATWGISAVTYPVTSVVMTILPGTTSPVFDVTLNGLPVDLSSSIGTVGTSASNAIYVASTTQAAALDAVAPNTPTGLALTPSTITGPDGGEFPAMVASWNANSETDLDAYELQIDAAILGDVGFTLSASGSGGSLTAGTYQVIVTGQGQIQGETFTSAVKSQVVTTGQRLYVNISPKGGITTYKLYASLDADPKGSPTPATTATTGSNVEITAAGAGAVSPNSSTALSFVNPKNYRTAGTTLTLNDIAGATYYGARLRAVDRNANRSGWSGIITANSSLDAVAPTMLSGLAAVAGFRLAGVRWNRNIEADLSYYEIRFAPEGTPGSPDTANWTTLATTGTRIVIENLEPDTKYYFQGRSIDRSGNCVTSAADPTAVQADDNPEAGWSNTTPDWITATPTLVGAADVAFNTVVANFISTGTLDAGAITTGTISVGGSAGSPDYLLVYNASAQEIGRWDANGLLVKDPADTTRQVRILNGVLSFSSDNGASWQTAINAEGIDATKITFGAEPGGHNSIPNSSFELAGFNTTLEKIWTSTGDWSGHFGTPVGVDTSGSSLQLVSAVY